MPETTGAPFNWRIPDLAGNDFFKTGFTAIRNLASDIAASMLARGTNIVTSTTRPANPTDGMTIWETDTKAFGYYDAASATWQMFDTKTQTYTPAWSTNGTNAAQPILNNGTISGRYRRRGEMIDMRIVLDFGSSTNAGSGDFRFTLPFTAGNVGEQIIDAKGWSMSAGLNFWGYGYIGASTGFVYPNFVVSRTDTGMQIARSASIGGGSGTGIPNIAGTYPFTTGSNIVIVGSYEAV